MSEDYFVEVNVKIRRSAKERLDNIISYINKREELLNSDRKSKPTNLSEFVCGATIREIERIETFYHQISSGKHSSLKGKGTIKNRIKEITKELNLKQYELSELTGIDRSNLSMIMNNHSQPSIDYLFRIWIALDFYPLEKMFYREKD